MEVSVNRIALEECDNTFIEKSETDFGNEIWTNKECKEWENWSSWKLAFIIFLGDIHKQNKSYTHVDKNNEEDSNINENSG
jgi:hypothetical protein